MDKINLMKAKVDLLRRAREALPKCWPPPGCMMKYPEGEPFESPEIDSSPHYTLRGLTAVRLIQRFKCGQPGHYHNLVAFWVYHDKDGSPLSAEEMRKDMVDEVLTDRWVGGLIASWNPEVAVMPKK